MLLIEFVSQLELLNRVHFNSSLLVGLLLDMIIFIFSWLQHFYFLIPWVLHFMKGYLAMYLYLKVIAWKPLENNRKWQLQLKIHDIKKYFYVSISASYFFGSFSGSNTRIDRILCEIDHQLKIIVIVIKCDGRPLMKKLWFFLRKENV